MNLRLLPYSIFSIIILAVAGCKSTPDGVPGEKDMARVVADVYRGESAVDYNNSIYNTDSAKGVVRLSVLDAHGMTLEQFDTAMAWYGRHIDRYTRVLDLAVEYLEGELEKIPDDEYGIMFVSGDTAQVWPLAQYRTFIPGLSADNIIFELHHDDAWEYGDQYQLNYKLAGDVPTVYTGLAVDYDDGTTEFHTASATEEGWNRQPLFLDSTRVALRVYGFLQPDELTRNFYIDSISLTRTRVNRQVYLRRVRQNLFEYGQQKPDSAEIEL